jgi:hypothetical protein
LPVLFFFLLIQIRVHPRKSAADFCYAKRGRMV